MSHPSQPADSRYARWAMAGLAFFAAFAFLLPVTFLVLLNSAAPGQDLSPASLPHPAVITVMALLQLGVPVGVAAVVGRRSR